MKILLINGSPNEKGCTYTGLMEIANELVKQGAEYEVYQIGKSAHMPCVACRACKKLGKCVINDDANELAEKIAGADGVVIGSPVYYASLNGNLKCLLDRTFFSNGAKFRYKPTAAIACARRAGTTATLDEINKYFMITEMPVVSSQYWNMVHGAKPEDVQKDEEGTQTMRVLARNMVWLIRSIQVAKDNGVELPEREDRRWTNFVK